MNADDELVPYLAVMSSVESLHRMTREERDLDGTDRSGKRSSHRVQSLRRGVRALRLHGRGVWSAAASVRRRRIEQWAERRGVLVKSIEDAALGMASVYRALGMPLPDRDGRSRAITLSEKFTELLARFMPFDLVIDERDGRRDEARVSKTSVCGSWGAIAGELRYFADRSGNPRAAIEGTQIPMHLIRRVCDAWRDGDRVRSEAEGRAARSHERRSSISASSWSARSSCIEEFPPEIAERARQRWPRRWRAARLRHPCGEEEIARRSTTIRETVSKIGRRDSAVLDSPISHAGTSEQLGAIRTRWTNSGTRASHFDRDEFVPREVRERYARASIDGGDSRSRGRHRLRR